MHLVLGGTGSLGRVLVARLLKEGHAVRVLTRSPARAAALAATGVEVMPGDLLQRASVERACRGAEVVVAAAHSLFGRGRTASEQVDGRAHRALVDAARAAGVARFVYVSVHDYGDAYQAVPFFRIKRETETYVRSSAIAWTVVRPTAFMETHAHLLIGEPILRTGKVTLFGRGEQPRNFVAADDVARIVVRAGADPSLTGETIAVGGPENLTAMEVVRLYERLAGRAAKVTHLPLGALGVVSRLLRPLHPGISQVIRAGILSDTTDQRFDATPLRERFGYEPTRLEAWAAARVQSTAPG